MPTPQQNQLVLARFAVANDLLAYSILGLDLLVYTGLVVASVLIQSLLLKIVFGSLAGFFIAQLFVIAHDAGHASYVSSRRANAVIARITMMPALHNYTLWLFVHNRLHHAFTNVKGLNSWSPLSLAEYQAMPRWRRALEHIYRSPVGLGIYYLCERWWKDKLVPRAHTPQKYRRGGWQDFGLNMLFLTALVSGVVMLALYSGQNPLLAVALSVLLPFIVWNYAMGLTTYQQHTHPDLEWYQSFAQARDNRHSTSEVSIYMRYASWYLLITHHCYVHPVHHANARIPLYNLNRAQNAYNQAFPESSNIVPFSLGLLLSTMKRCKLYDYEHNCWLDFRGKTTSETRRFTRDTDEQSTTHATPLRRIVGE